MSCDRGAYHFGSSHTNDMCDVWTLSSSDNIQLLGKLYTEVRTILRNTRYTTYNYIVSTGMRYKKDKNFIRIYDNFENEKVVCYYPERLMREYLTNSICLTYHNIHGAVNRA